MKQKKLLMLVAIVLVVVLCASVLTACNKDKDETVKKADDVKTGIYDEAVYSYRMGPSDLPTAWNIQTYQSNSATYVLDYSSDSLYTFDYNDDYTGYKIVPSMAADYATDVTSQYVGQYGIKEGDENKVYSIPLKTNLKFDNGDVINANTFVESMKLLLNPKAANFRADNVYKSGNLKIYGAENYVKQGSIVLRDCTDGNGKDYQDWAWADPTSYTLKSGTTKYDTYPTLANVALTETQQKSIFFAVSDESYFGAWAYDWYDDSSASFAKVFSYIAYNYTSLKANTETYPDRASVETVIANMASLSLYDILQNAQYSEILEALMYEFWITDPGEEFGFFGYEETIPSYDWEDVGFFAKDDNTLVIVLINEMEDNFYLRYELCTNFFLVNPTLYTQCISEEGGVYSNNYGTSVDTYVGYGPYKLTQYVADSTIILERNDKWHGYAESEYKAGTYQTDKVVYTKVEEDSTRLEMFLKGELDSYGLQAEDMEDYISSDYIYYTDSESTWYLAMNPDETTLQNNQEAATSTTGKTVVKTVLAIQEFRQALSYSLDREQFNLLLSPTSGIAKGLLSSMIVADPESGKTYRSLDEAKDAILNFWGLADAWGEGKEYATRDDAIASITGYDPSGAKQLFTTAYNKAVAKGYITEGNDNWIVQIVIGMPSAGNYYTKGAEFLATNWTNAVKDTPFEGHIEFINSQVLGSTSFGEYLRNGSVDLLFGVGYGGSMFDPYSMMDCFTGSLQYDPFTDKTKIDCDITYDFGAGTKTYRASLYDWVSECLQGNEITITELDADGNPTANTLKVSAGTSDPAAMRIAILAQCETKIMTLSNIFPVQTDASASLKGMRVQYKTEEYVVGMGRGGIQYYTYAMSDDAWASYVASQEGGKLNYK